VGDLCSCFDSPGHPAHEGVTLVTCNPEECLTQRKKSVLKRISPSIKTSAEPASCSWPLNTQQEDTALVLHSRVPTEKALLVMIIKAFFSRGEELTTSGMRATKQKSGSFLKLILC
jgi:hypothetical protein